VADTLKDVVAALCQTARDYSLARSRSDAAAAENWQMVFTVVLESRLSPTGRGAALAAFRAEDCPGVEREFADELAPPPLQTVSLSSATVRWLSEASGLDIASEFPHLNHLGMGGAQPAGRVDLPVEGLLRMAALAEGGLAAHGGLGQANPWPRGTRERDLWGLVKQWELICRESNIARTTPGQVGQEAYNRARNDAASFDRQVSEYLTAAEIAWVKKIGYELCDLPRGSTYSPPPIRIPTAPSRATVTVWPPPVRSPFSIPLPPPQISPRGRWFPPIASGLQTYGFPGIFLS
jgi:hypothetical protein